MKFVKPLLILTLALVAFSPAMSMAQDGTTVSHKLKKQGLVPFQNKPTEQNASQDQYEPVAPANIEPAAGESDIQPDQHSDQPSALSEKIRLPRKN